MTVEAATTINQLNISLPLDRDPESEGADHLRLIKSVLLATFPKITGAIEASDTDLNGVPTLAAGLATATTNIAANTTALATASTAISSLNTGLSAAQQAINANATAITVADQQITATNSALGTTNTAVATKAPLASPSLSGTPTAPSAVPSTSSTQIATMAAVAASIVAGTGLAIGSGSVQLPGGYILKFGSSSSGAQGNGAVTFSTPFPNTCAGVFLTENGATNWAGTNGTGQPTVHGVKSVTASAFASFSMNWLNSNWGGASGLGFNWFAIGN